MSSRKVHQHAYDPYAIAESDDHTTELPPGRPTAVLTGPQQVDVLT